MTSFLLLSLPIFAAIGAGWLAVRLDWFDGKSLATLGEFSFRFALPALVLRTMASQPLAQTFHPVFFAGLLSASLICFAATLLYFRTILNCRAGVAAGFGTAATVSNLGFLGVPLLLALFGNKSAGPLAMAIMSEVGVVMALGITLMGLSRNGDADQRDVLRSVLKVTLLNPVILAIGIGIALASHSITLATPIDRFLDFLGSAAGPTSLFALGGSIVGQKLSRRSSRAVVLMTVKLLVYPVVAYLILKHVLSLESFWVGAGVLIASLPTAGNVFVLAQRADAEPEQISTGIILSTLLSALTFPYVAWRVLT